ncbi:MAG: hypothetical protein WC708_10445 [Lentisphaeria bacterium]
MKKLLVALALLAFVAGAHQACAQQAATGMTPFALGLFYPVQIPDETFDVYGMRLNIIAGKNASVNGLDIGLVNISSVEANCIEVGAFWNEVDGDMRGLQFSGLFNVVDGAAMGLQAAFILNQSGKGTGDVMAGFQIGLIDIAGDASGMQIGGLNVAQNIVGMQIGVINWAQDMTGVQIGVVNIIEGGPLPFFPVINASF